MRYVKETPNPSAFGQENDEKWVEGNTKVETTIDMKPQHAHLAEKRFEHSEELVKRGIIPWLEYKESHGIPTSSLIFEDQEYCRIEIESEKLYSSGLNDPQLEYFDVISQHLESGYPTQWNGYNTVKEESQLYCQHVQEFLLILKKRICRIVEGVFGRGVPEYYHYGKAPIEYFNPFSIVLIIYKDMKNAVKGYSSRWSDYFEVRLMDDEQDAYLLNCGGLNALIRSKTESEVEEIKVQLIDFIKKAELIDIMQKLVHREQELQGTLKKFKDFLNELKKQVMLKGSTLKGCCRYCPA